ncbi:MAG TPA: hypothetical protein VFD58_29130 [Blastocatellia bacterium]|nr:hypothetical protein [Blastocatellia bacterium]
MWNSNLVSPNQVASFVVMLEIPFGAQEGWFSFRRRMRIVPEPGSAAQSALPPESVGLTRRIQER